MNIFITGGAGFVGSNLAIKFKQTYPDYTVIVFDNLKRRGSELNLPRLKKAGVLFIHGDIRNKEDFENIPKYDLMIECSAEPSVLAGVDSSPLYLLNTNLVGTINCLESVRQNKAKMLFISTSRVYPVEKINNLSIKEDATRFILDDSEGISESFPIDGARTLYGATKLSSELLIQEYISTYNLEAIINRCGVIAGPWQMGKVDQGFITLWVSKHIFGGELSYIGYGGSGKQVRDFIHIDDLFDLINLQTRDFEKYAGEIFNVGGGKENSVSLMELTKICRDITEKTVKITSKLENRKGDLKLYISDITKINKISGWRPKKKIDVLVKDIYEWIISNKKNLQNILE